MDICRICLKDNADKHLHELKSSKKDGSKDYIEMFLFCLNIQVAEDSKITKKLCSKCFKKVLSYYKFKSMALKSDEYLKSEQLLVKSESSTIVPQDLFASVVTVDYFDTDVKMERLESNIKCEENDDRHEDDNKDISFVKQESSLDADSDSNDPTFDALQFLDNFDPDLGTTTTTNNKSDIETKVLKRNKKRATKQKTKGSKKAETENTEIEILAVPGVCDQCGANVKNLKAHALVHVPKHQRVRYPCKVCDKTFSSMSSMYTHNTRKHLKKLSHCSLCNKDYTSLKMHMLLTHNPEQMPLQCGVCSSRFPCQSALDRHMTHHTKEKAFQCETCGTKFRLKVLLDRHVRSVHNKEKNFTCHLCSKSFFKKYHFANHMRTHTKEKPYTCAECGRSFATSNTLRIHMLQHTDVRGYPCKLCEKTFKSNSTLYMHMRAHRKERPYPCPYCDIRFARTFDRKRHLLKHHPQSSVPGQTTLETQLQNQSPGLSDMADIKPGV